MKRKGCCSNFIPFVLLSPPSNRHCVYKPAKQDTQAYSLLGFINLDKTAFTDH